MIKYINRFLNDYSHNVNEILKIVFGINTLLAFAIIVITTGFYLTEEQYNLLQIIINFIIIIFIMQEIIY
jgi:hypothetical protein